MKRLYALLLGLALIFSAYAGNSQDADPPKSGFSLRYLLPNYQFPLYTTLKKEDLGSGIELEYLRRLGRFADLALPLRMAGVAFPSDVNGAAPVNGFFLSADIQFQLKYFPATAGFNPWVYSGLGLALENEQRIRLGIPVGFGADLRLKDGLFLSSRLEYRLGGGYLREYLLGGVGLKIVPGAEQKTKGWSMPVTQKGSRFDRDGDGVKDDEDECPDVPGLKIVAGCPDRDGDGFPDHLDECPDVAGTLRGCPDADGDGIPDKDDLCPLEVGTPERGGCPVRDRDGDGIEDHLDECPDEAGPTETRGCPDRDGDGIADKDDTCPDAQGPAQTRGCPDSDGDGVPDKDDRCPNTPGLPSLGGCPEVTQEDQRILTSAMKQVQFEGNSERLKFASFEVLDEVVELLRRYPDFLLTVIGHTDNAGNAEANVRLSRDRAQACYEYFITRGIGPSRLHFTGMGGSRPLTSNATPEGRALNRRVEFVLSVKAP